MASDSLGDNAHRDTSSKDGAKDPASVLEPSYEYTIEMGWDSHTSAGYDKEVYSSPEKALAAWGGNFHPDCDSVVFRKAGETMWRYKEADQKYDRLQKLQEYEVAYLARKAHEAKYRRKRNSAHPRNRRVRTITKVIPGKELHLWRYARGAVDTTNL
jgi:hypothetical protein